MSTQDAEKPCSSEHAQRLFVLPEDATEVVLVRHGATQGMVDGRPFEADEDGHGNPPLSPTARSRHGSSATGSSPSPSTTRACS